MSLFTKEGLTFHTARVALGALEATKELVASPTAGAATDTHKPALRIWRIVYVPSNTTVVGMVLAIGTVTILSRTGACVANVPIDTGELGGGIVGDAETALVCTCTPANPAGEFFITYSIESVI
jgi:hypothetical protein